MPCKKYLLQAEYKAASINDKGTVPELTQRMHNSYQPGCSRDSNTSSGKVETDDSHLKALSIRFSHWPSPSHGSTEFYDTSSDDPFPEVTARNISSFPVDFSQSKFYSAALIATSTPRNKYEPEYLTKFKQSSSVCWVSINTPPSAPPKSISTTEVLADRPRFACLGGWLIFLQNGWDCSTVTPLTTH